MQRARTAALLWLLAGIAFLVAAFLTSQRRPAFFAVAVLFFGVSVITSRRGRSSDGTR